jgi:hypothetical protein
VSCRSLIRTPNSSRRLLSHGPDTLPAQRPGHCNTQASFTPCNHIPSRVPARLSPTRSTGGHPLYTDRPPSTGTASVTGPGSAQADSDPKTSLSRPPALTWNWSTVLTLIRSHPPTSRMPMVTMSEIGPYPKTGEQVPVPQVLRCSTMTPRRAPRAPWKAQDVSHIMAPAVCILNPSNGTHNCRPGWRTCLGSTPSGSALLYACARPKPPSRTKKAQVRLASPSERRGGFGTCGWTGAGRPRIRPTACSRRRHAGTSPRCTC